MDFNFNLKDYISDELVTKVNSSLLPHNFSGDRRSAAQCSGAINEVLNEMGMASAKAQGLMKPITSGEKLRNSDHTVYLLIEDNYGRRTVVGLLKIGTKNLFVYDTTGHVHETKATCILDFYIHESKQRMGYGKILYDFMLQDIAVLPHKLAIDKPSEKFLSFLYKHYGLQNIIPQSNNFVLFDGFFEKFENGQDSNSTKGLENNLKFVTESNHKFINRNSLTDHKQELPLYGRHAAYKHTTSIGQCMKWDDTGRVTNLRLNSTNGNYEHTDLKHHHSQLW